MLKDYPQLLYPDYEFTPEKHDDLVRFEIMKQFGCYVTESSEHNAEFMPYFIRKSHPELIEKYQIPLDEYPRRCRIQIEHWKQLKNQLVGNMLIPILLVAFGGTGSAHAYFMTAVIFAVVGCSLYLTCFGLVREHVQAPTEKFSFALAFKSLFTNKPLFCIMITNLVINLAFIMKMTLNYYYTTYTLGDVKLMSLMSLITLPSILLGTAAAPFLTKLVGKKKTLLGLMIANLVISAIFWLVGYGSIPLVLLMGALQILCVGASFVVISSMTADTIEYGEWMTGQRNEGVITSTRTLITKAASALVGVAVAAVLTMTGYVPNVAQSAQTMGAFHFVVSFLPGIVMMIGAIPMFFYSLTEERHAQIMEELKERRAQKESDK